MPTPSPIIAASTGAIDVIGVTDENTVMDISPNISPATALSSGATIASTYATATIGCGIHETGSTGSRDAGGVSSKIRLVFISAFGRLDVNVALLVAVVVIVIAAAS